MKPFQTTFQNVGSSNPGGGSGGVTPVIVNSYPYGPSGTVNGVVVVFNEAVDPSTFVPSDVSLTRPDGTSVAITGVSVQGGRNQTYNISVAPQTQGGTYSMQVNSVKDAQGDVMKPYQTTFQNVATSSTASTAVVSAAAAGQASNLTAASPVAIPTDGIAVSSLKVGPGVSIGGIQVGLNIQHTQDSDLYIHLVAPDGTDIILSNRRGGSGQNYTGTVFTTSAGTAISKGQAPFTGTFTPDGSLASLIGKNAAGIWKLWVPSLGSSHTGTLVSWSLSITPARAA
jgi:subtilisin-like proprotein convertase family protein